VEEGTARPAGGSAGTLAPGADLPATAPEVVPIRRIRRARAWRRVGLGILGAVVVLGALQVLGPRTSTVAASADGYDVAIDYPATTRPGLATTWRVRLTATEGAFGGPIRITVPAAYLGVFDWNAIQPEPASSTSVAGAVVWTFERPDGATFEVTIDARVQPSRQWGADGTTRVEVGDREIAVLTYRTEVMP
jgi:hypothetical protein